MLQEGHVFVIAKTNQTNWCFLDFIEIWTRIKQHKTYQPKAKALEWPIKFPTFLFNWKILCKKRSFVTAKTDWLQQGLLQKNCSKLMLVKKFTYLFIILCINISVQPLPIFTIFFILKMLCSNCECCWL